MADGKFHGVEIRPHHYTHRQLINQCMLLQLHLKELGAPHNQLFSLLLRTIPQVMERASEDWHRFFVFKKCIMLIGKFVKP